MIRVSLFFVALCVLLSQITAERMGLGRPAKDLVLKEGHKEGRSTYIKYSRAVQHGVSGFWDEHAKHFGLETEHVRAQMTVRARGDSSTFVHHTQTIDGYEVLGGGVVMMLDKKGNVVKSRGHPIPSEEQKEMKKPAKTVGLKVVSENIANYMRKDKTQKVDVKITSSKLMWYRGGLGDGAKKEKPHLVYHIQGKARRQGEDDVPVFDAFVCAARGTVLELADVGLRAKQANPLSKKLDTEEKKKAWLNHKYAKLSQKKKAQAATATKMNKPAIKAPVSSLRGSVANKAEAKAKNVVSMRAANLKSVQVQVYDCEFDENCDSPGAAKHVFDSSVDSIKGQPYDIQLAAFSTAEMALMIQSLTDGAIVNYKMNDGTIDWKIVINLGIANAYFTASGDYTAYGAEYFSDDILGHEWYHAYTEYGPGYIYHYQPGALNEAMSDVFGEAQDLLNEGFLVEDEPKTARTDSRKCLAEYTGNFGEPVGTDTGCRWVMGDHATWIRDMLNPQCFGDPDTVYSQNYLCANDAYYHWNGWDDYGGVHYNSGVVNRVFALLTDGGDLEDSNGQTVTVVGEGLTKTLGLFMASWQMGMPLDQFADFGQDMLDICYNAAQDGDTLCIPDLEEGTCVRDSNPVTDEDCAKLEVVLQASGMLDDVSEYCAGNGVTQGIHADDAATLCAIVDHGYPQLEYWTQTSQVAGWLCEDGKPLQDPCSNTGSWKGVICKGDQDGYGRVHGIIIPYYYFGYDGHSMIPEWFRFPFMEYFDVYGNYFGGAVPNTICDLPMSATIDLSSNDFTCAPACISQFGNSITTDRRLATCPSSDDDDHSVDDGDDDPTCSGLSLTVLKMMSGTWMSFDERTVKPYGKPSKTSHTVMDFMIDARDAAKGIRLKFYLQFNEYFRRTPTEFDVTVVEKSSKDSHTVTVPAFKVGPRSEDVPCGTVVDPESPHHGSYAVVARNGDELTQEMYVEVAVPPFENWRRGTYMITIQPNMGNQAAQVIEVRPRRMRPDGSMPIDFDDDYYAGWSSDPL